MRDLHMAEVPQGSTTFHPNLRRRPKPQQVHNDLSPCKPGNDPWRKCFPTTSTFNSHPSSSNPRCFISQPQKAAPQRHRPPRERRTLAIRMVRHSRNNENETKPNPMSTSNLAKTNEQRRIDVLLKNLGIGNVNSLKHSKLI